MSIPVVYNRFHTSHQPTFLHVDAGLAEYWEKPERLDSIYAALQQHSLAKFIDYSDIDTKVLTNIHTKEYIEFLQSLAKNITDNQYHTPPSFHSAIYRNDLSFKAQLGKFSASVDAPVSSHTCQDALQSFSTAYIAAQKVQQGEKIVYALTRPPGHHAMKDKMSGFCYLNNTAGAAQYLSQFGKVAILDVDFHHGNGTQDIFYDRSDVFTVSIHGNPHNHFPHYWGFTDEKGVDEGEGYNLNIPLQTGIRDEEYHQHLMYALEQIKQFNPSYLVVPLGFDTYEKDQLGDFKLTTSYYTKMAGTIKQLNLPTVITQEGGYYLPDLGANAVAFFQGWLT